MIEIELNKRTKEILMKLGKMSLEEIPYCGHMTKWQLNEFCEKSGDRKIIEGKLTEQFGNMEIRIGTLVTQQIDTKVYIVIGSLYTYFRECVPSRYNSYDIEVIYYEGYAKRVILHGNINETIIHNVKTDGEHFYMLRESEIRYIDCVRNNCIWHCYNYDVRERITLKSVGNMLTDSFCKINKSCIVNLNHVYEMKHYEIIMDNEDVLFISRRLYQEVKNKIKSFYI